MYTTDALVIPSAIAGLPGVSVPAGFTKEGLPVGLQILVPQRSESLMFAVAKDFEDATEYYKQLPSE